MNERRVRRERILMRGKFKRVCRVQRRIVQFMLLVKYPFLHRDLHLFVYENEWKGWSHERWFMIVFFVAWCDTITKAFNPSQQHYWYNWPIRLSWEAFTLFEGWHNTLKFLRNWSNCLLLYLSRNDSPFSQSSFWLNVRENIEVLIDEFKKQNDLW